MKRIIGFLLVFVVLVAVAVSAQRTTSLTAALLIDPNSPYPAEQIKAAALVGAQVANEYPKFPFKYTVRVATASNLSQTIRTLHEQDKINVFFGTLTSSDVASVQNYVNSQNILLFSTSSSLVSLAKNDNIFRSVGTNSQIALIIKDHITLRLKLNNVIIVHLNDGYGTNLKKQLITLLGSTSTTVLGSVSYPRTGYTLDIIASRVRALVPAGLNINKLGIILISFSEYSDIMTKLIQNPRLQCYYIGADSTAQGVIPDNILDYANVRENGFSRVTFTTIFEYFEIALADYAPYVIDILSDPLVQWIDRISTRANSDLPLSTMANYVFDTSYLIGLGASLAQSNQVPQLKQSIVAFAETLFLLTAPTKFDEFGDRKALTYAAQYLATNGTFVLAR